MTPAAPGDERWHRRYWNRYNRPYTGCGCLYAIVIVFLIWWLISWFWAPGWWGGGR